MPIVCFACGGNMSNQGCITDLCVCGGETTRSLWKCDICGRFYYNDYYDCWNTDTPDDIWFEIPESVFSEALGRMKSCPEPHRKLCDCPNHPFSIDLSSARKVEK